MVDEKLIIGGKAQSPVRVLQIIGAVHQQEGGVQVPLDPSAFVFEDWVLDAIKADSQAWQFFNSCPDNYRRIKVDRIQHYHHTAREDYARHLLSKFVCDCHAGRLQPGWSDFGRLG